MNNNNNFVDLNEEILVKGNFKYNISYIRGVYYCKVSYGYEEKEIHNYFLLQDNKKFTIHFNGITLSNCIIIKCEYRSDIIIKMKVNGYNPFPLPYIFEKVESIIKKENRNKILNEILNETE